MRASSPMDSKPEFNTSPGYGTAELSHENKYSDCPCKYVPSIGGYLADEYDNKSGRGGCDVDQIKTKYSLQQRNRIISFL
jgi:hypothetical protein